ncbi:MAG: hypothetical protein KGJ90_00030 [Patescibacteria group bacterium]|nr:hypothetical protein [Patescibacteria group bacterium]
MTNDKLTKNGEYSDNEAAKRAEEAIRRSFTMPHVPRKSMVPITPQGRAQQNRRASRGSPKSK